MSTTAVREFQIGPSFITFASHKLGEAIPKISFKPAFAELRRDAAAPLTGRRLKTMNLYLEAVLATPGALWPLILNATGKFDEERTRHSAFTVPGVLEVRPLDPHNSDAWRFGRAFLEGVAAVNDAPAAAHAFKILFRAEAATDGSGILERFTLGAADHPVAAVRPALNLAKLTGNLAGHLAAKLGLVRDDSLCINRFHPKLTTAYGLFPMACESDEFAQPRRLRWVFAGRAPLSENVGMCQTILDAARQLGSFAPAPAADQPAVAVQVDKVSFRDPISDLGMTKNEARVAFSTFLV